MKMINQMDPLTTNRTFEIAPTIEMTDQIRPVRIEI
jgi:hypothetical protein